MYKSTGFNINYRLLTTRLQRASFFRRSIRAVLPAFALCTGTMATADVLLTGVAIDSNKAKVEFSLSGESREDVVGGEIRFGDSRFNITHVSVHRLVGAESANDSDESFAVFSSSYTAQTATGTPWVAGDTYIQCDEEYNSFLAIYKVRGEDAEKLPDPPFRQLTESTDHSDTSIVYCFVSAPEDK